MKASFLDPRATGATDDVSTFAGRNRPTERTRPGGNVRKNLPTGGDLFHGLRRVGAP